MEWFRGVLGRAAAIGLMVCLALLVVSGVCADVSLAGPLREIGHNTKVETMSAVQQLFILGVVIVFALLAVRRMFPLMVVMFFVCGFVGWVVFTPDQALGTMRDVFDSFKPGGGGGGAGTSGGTGGTTYR